MSKRSESMSFGDTLPRARWNKMVWHRPAWPKLWPLFDLPSNAWFPLCHYNLRHFTFRLYFRYLHLNTSLNWCCPASTAGKSKFSQLDIWIFSNRFYYYCDMGSQRMMSLGFQRSNHHHSLSGITFNTYQFSHFSGKYHTSRENTGQNLSAIMHYQCLFDSFNLHHI